MIKFLRSAGTVMMAAAVLIPVLVACTWQDTPATPMSGIEASETGILSFTISGMIPWEADSRALMTAHKVRATLENPHTGVSESRDFEVSGPGAEVLWDGLQAGTGWKIQVDLFNTRVSDTLPQVSGKGSVDILPGTTSEISVRCLPVAPQVLTVADFPWTVSLPAGGEAWSSLSLTREGRYSFAPGLETCTVRFFSLNGQLLGESVQGRPWVLETSGAQDIFMGIHHDLTAVVSLELEAEYPPAQEGSPMQPFPLEPSLEFRNFLLGKVGGSEDSSWYALNPKMSGTWWVDLPYSSDYRWELTASENPAVVLASGSNSTGLKFELIAGKDYLLVLKNIKAIQDLKISGRLLSAPLQLEARYSEGSPLVPTPLALEIPLNWKMGGRNFDCTSWYTFVSGASGWQEFHFGEAGVGSYGVELYHQDFSGSPLLTWSNTENLVQRVKLNSGELYHLKALGQFSSGIKDTLWPLKIVTADLPESSVVETELWQSGNLAAGGVDWYRFPVKPGQWYLVCWDDKTQGSGEFSGDVRVSAYTSERKDALFLYKDKGYSTRWVVQAPPGETELYCLVQGYSPTSSGTFGLKVSQDGGGLSMKVQ